MLFRAKYQSARQQHGESLLVKDFIALDVIADAFHVHQVVPHIGQISWCKAERSRWSHAVGVSLVGCHWTSTRVLVGGLQAVAAACMLLNLVVVLFDRSIRLRNAFAFQMLLNARLACCGEIHHYSMPEHIKVPSIRLHMRVKEYGAYLCTAKTDKLMCLFLKGLIAPSKIVFEHS